MNVPRKKPAVRLFAGLAGRFTPEEKPSLEIASPLSAGPAMPAMAPPSPESIAALEQEILTAKKKRGRPAAGEKAMTAAERKQKSRARLAEASTKAVVVKAYLDEIKSAMHENRDSAGRLHGEGSGGGVAESILEKLSYKDDGRVKASGCDPRAFERGSYRGVKETAAQWAKRQNFYAAAKWSASEKEAYVERLTDRCCHEEYRCKFGDFVSTNPDDVAEHFLEEHSKDVHLSVKKNTVEPGTELIPTLEEVFEKELPDDHCVGQFRCLMGDFTSDKYDEVRNHFAADHKGYIRSMVRYHEPRHISAPRTFSTQDPPVDPNFVTDSAGREENV